jgi:transcriptional regulator with XRE-family HTH domain
MTASISFDESFSFALHDVRMATKRQVDLERGERIKFVRTKVLNLASQEKLAQLLAKQLGVDVTRGAVGNWEQGKDVGFKSLRALATLADISFDWLATGEGDGPSEDSPGGARPKREVPIVGYVSAGAAHFFASGDGELDRVPAPDGATDETVAVEIRGESLGALFDQWLIFYDEVRSPVTSDLIGRLCVVALPDDRVLVKRIRRAKTPGFYHLESNTEGTIFDVEIVWAARVTNMTPR